MPWARAPKAPWVEVWLSPQTMVMPGWVRPCSGPTTWTMPLRESPMGKNSMPCVGDVALQGLQLQPRLLVGHRVDAQGLALGRHIVVGDREGAVGPAHAAGARRAGRRRPAGVVTSWIRCRSM